VLSTLVGSLGDESVLRTCHVALGGEVGRHQIFCAYHGRDAEAYVNGIQMVRGNELIDTTLLMDHVEPGGISRELFKTVVRDSGVGVFQGKIIVEPFAQKSDGRMMSAALLLSENAAMNNKPELEIYADDVVCAHGATCGQPDEDLLFYLMTRGIPRIEAEALVLRAFLGEALEGLEHPGVVEDIEKYIGMWLHSQVA
jgi:Fe-S cluster assembly protein SufD